MKCGAALPPVGECPACAAAAAAETLPGAPPAVPGLLNQDIHIDRRRTPERTPAVSEPTVPSFADLASGPAAPPGMMPARRPTPPPQPAVPLAAPRTQTPPMGTQAPTIPPPGAAPLAQPLPVPPPPRSAVPAPGGDPEETAPGYPPFAAPPPTAMASPAQRPGLPVPPTAPPSHPVAPEPGTHSRPHPVEVVTFSPPARVSIPTSPALLPSDEHLTPRLPMPIPPPLSSAPAQVRTGVSNAARPEPGVQEIHARPASLWRRLLSFSIDTAAIVGVATLYITLASSVAGVKAPSSQGLTALDSIAAWMHALKAVLLPGAILLVVLAAVYCAVAAFLWNGRTLGRLLLGLRLVDTHGVAPAPTRAIIRAMLSVVSFGLFLGGFWMALFDRRGQTLHDKLTSTFVIQPS